MARDLGHAAATVAHIEPAEARLLTSIERPIVLVRRKSATHVSTLVAPGNPRLGLLLPYTPLHHLLFAPVPGAPPGTEPPAVLVMTSGNLTDEPICFDDEDARTRLADLADAWLLHDRPIHVPCDDSVLQVDPVTGAELPLRRSRGYAPLPVHLPFEAAPTLAVGGELKNTFCLAAGRDAFMSQHIGDMGSLETWAAFERSVDQLSGLYQIDTGQVAADAHPGYRTRHWADDVAGEAVAEVYHHHAHVASVMAEHGVAPDQAVVGIAFDGTGYGTDGTIWGGEVLVAGYGGFERVAHLRPLPLPGGDGAVRRPVPRRAGPSVGGRHRLVDRPVPGGGHPGRGAAGAGPAARARGRLRADIEHGAPLRRVSARSLGLRHRATYEAQAAMELQWVAEAFYERAAGTPPDYRFAVTAAGDGVDTIDPGPVLRSVVADLRAGVDTGCIAAGFHAAVARLVGDVAEHQCARTDVATVALTGGVFQNVLLLGLARRELEARGLHVLTHRLVPPNDGGIALGQAAVAGFRCCTRAAAGCMMTTVPLRRSTKTKAPPPPADGPAEDLAAAALSLARRFADGATMWCVAPAWPSHARHVAVEFVHPVIVGTRALPAVSLERGDGGRAGARPVPSRRRPARREHGGPPGGARPAGPRRGLGAHQRVAGCRASPAARSGHARGAGTWSGSTTRTRPWPPARASWCSSITCCGS